MGVEEEESAVGMAEKRVGHKVCLEGKPEVEVGHLVRAE